MLPMTPMTPMLLMLPMLPPEIVTRSQSLYSDSPPPTPPSPTPPSLSPLSPTPPSRLIPLLSHLYFHLYFPLPISSLQHLEPLRVLSP